MNKAQELEILNAAVIALTKNSYSADWLREQIPQIEIAMRGDYPPEFYACSFTEMHCQTIEARELLTAARTEAETIKREAHAMGDEILADARREAARVMEAYLESSACALERAARSIRNRSI